MSDIPAGTRFRDMTTEQKSKIKFGLIVLGVLITLGVLVALGILKLILMGVAYFGGQGISLGGALSFAFVKTAQVYNVSTMTVGLFYVAFIVVLMLICALTRQAFVLTVAATLLLIVYILHSFACLLA